MSVTRLDRERAEDEQELHRLKKDNAALRREIRTMQLSLETKNKELDALHYVWCNGGCETGTHRWTEQTISEEVVKKAERNTARLRTWFENHKHRKRRWGLWQGR